MMILDSTSGSSSTTYSYARTDYGARGISFANDYSEDATIVVNGESITVKPGEVFDGYFPQKFTSVGITVTGAYRMLIGR